MSCIYKNKIIDSELSKNAMGGTEMMRDRLLRHCRSELLSKFAIHFSRPRTIYSDVKNILYLHDLAADPENAILANGGWNKFDHFVFVSYWQRQQYIDKFDIPLSLTSVIHNAIEMDYTPNDTPTDNINFIYHTTPHRGLELLVPVFVELCKDFDNITLDVFSSFGVYGWKERDRQYQSLFDSLKSFPKIKNHGAVSNDVVLDHLKKSHIFLYPSVWQETSCIALIEAKKAGCVCIHPNLAALPETAGFGDTIMYDFHENPSVHAGRAYNTTKAVLNLQKSFPKFINNYSHGKNHGDKNSIQTFKDDWNRLMTDLSNE